MPVPATRVTTQTTVEPSKTLTVPVGVPDPEPAAVTVAVDNALNHEAARAYEEQLKRERDRLRALLEINNAVVSCLSSKPLFHAISASLRRTFGLDYASLLIYDAEASVLRLETCDFPGGVGAIREDAVVPVGDKMAGYVFRTREGRVFTLE